MLAKTSEPQVRIAVAQRSDCSIATLTYLACDADPAVCHEVARSTRAPAEVLAKLSTHSDDSVRVMVARNAASPPALHDRLGRDVDEAIRYSAAYAAYQSKDALAVSQFAAHPDDGFRWIVACIGDAQAVTQLFRDKSPRVRWSAHMREFGSDDDLRAGACDPDASVRYSVSAVSRVLPEAVAVALLADPDSRIRANLAARTDVSEHLRLKLADDADLYVRRVTQDIASDGGKSPSPSSPSMRLRARARSNTINEAEMFQIARSDDATSIRHLGRNRACTTPVRMLLAASDDVQVRRALAASRSEPAVLRQVLVLRDDLIDYTVAGNTRIPLPEHPRSWLSCSMAVREKLAARRDLGEELRLQLASDASALVRHAIATNPSSDPACLDLLAADVDHMVRAAVAGNRNTSTSTLRGLLDDTAYETRATLAGRLNRLGADVLSTLATNNRFRIALAMSKHSPPVLLGHLVADDSHLVVGQVARNPRATPAALVPMLVHPNAGCRHLATKRVTALSEEQALVLAADTSWTVREALAQNPITPSSALDVVAREDTLSIRLAVARNPNASDEALDLLARVWNHQIHSAVADNPRASASALDHLARDRNASTRAAVARHPNTATSTLGRLARDKGDRVRRTVAENPNTHSRTLRRLASDTRQWVRAVVGQNPSTPVAELDLLASDPAAEVRAAVAGNERTPLKVLIHLAADADSIVHRSLAKNPNLPDEERVLSALY